MRYGWARALAIGAVLATAACGRPAPGPEERAAANLEEAQAFMTRNATAEGVRALPSGVQYKVVQSGPIGGASPDNNDLVKVEYEGTLIDGTVFDSSYQRGAPAVFTLGTVVEGWTDALTNMKPGDEWIVYIPPQLGYGDSERGKIPSNSVLIFRLELQEVAPAPGGGRGSAIANG